MVVVGVIASSDVVDWKELPQASMHAFDYLPTLSTCAYVRLICHHDEPETR